MPLSELISLVAQAPCAVPVVYDAHNYLGIISKEMLHRLWTRRCQRISDTLQAQDPWATALTDPCTTPAPDLTAPSSDWLNSAPIQPVHFNLLDLFYNTWLPLGSWVIQGIDWLVLHFRPLFQGICVLVYYILNGF